MMDLYIWFSKSGLGINSQSLAFFSCSNRSCLSSSGDKRVNNQMHIRDIHYFICYSFIQSFTVSFFVLVLFHVHIGAFEAFSSNLPERSPRLAPRCRAQTCCLCRSRRWPVGGSRTPGCSTAGCRRSRPGASGPGWSGWSLGRQTAGMKCLTVK